MGTQPCFHMAMQFGPSQQPKGLLFVIAPTIVGDTGCLTMMGSFRSSPNALGSDGAALIEDFALKFHTRNMAAWAKALFNKI